MHSSIQALLLTSLMTAISCAATPRHQSARAASSQASQPGVATGSETPSETRSSAAELDADTLMGIARFHYADLRSCYETQLKENPQLQGMVEVELTIDSKGQIREGRITNDTIGHPELQFCIAQRILGWKFPPHADESLTVQFPFEFSPVLVDGPVEGRP